MTSYQAGMLLGFVLGVIGVFVFSAAIFAWMIYKAEELPPDFPEENWGKELGVTRSVFRSSEDGLFYEKFTQVVDEYGTLMTSTRLLRDQDDI